jgi:two-component system OmpR family sensor kinase
VVLVGWYVTRRALSPVKRIVDTVERIEVSRLDERLPVGAVKDELSRIASTINTMLERIEAGYERERRFTGDASHELRGPLAKVLADIDIALARERGAAEYRDTLVRCRSYARDMQRLVESLLCLARLDADRDATRRRAFDLTDLAAETARLLPEDHARRTRLDLAGEARVVTAYGAPELVRIMIRNLLQNALRYSPAESAVTVRLSRKNGCAQVEIEDRGEGIPEDELERVFSRFYRADCSRARATGGYGLGLAIVHEIAAAHGTTVTLTNLPGGGVCASFALPSEAPEANPASNQENPPAAGAAGGGER